MVGGEVYVEIGIDERINELLQVTSLRPMPDAGVESIRSGHGTMQHLVDGADDDRDRQHRKHDRTQNIDHDNDDTTVEPVGDDPLATRARPQHPTQG